MSQLMSAMKPASQLLFVGSVQPFPHSTETGECVLAQALGKPSPSPPADVNLPPLTPYHAM
eukprot:4511575-Prorocentrum_lima.AAC.1